MKLWIALAREAGWRHTLLLAPSEVVIRPERFDWQGFVDDRPSL